MAIYRIYRELAYQLEGDNGYLYIQTCESGYDYTFYDSDYQELDGGQLDNMGISIESAAEELLQDYNPDCDYKEIDVADFLEKVEK